MAEINLAPGTQYLLEVRRRQRRLYTIAVILVGGVATIMITIWLWQAVLNRQLTDVKVRLNGVEAELTKLKPVADRISLFEGRLQLMDSLLTSRRSSAPLLRELERLLPSSAVIVSFSVKMDEGIIELSGTTPTIEEVAKTLASLSAKPAHSTLFSRARLLSVSRQEPSGGAPVYSFSAQLSFSPNQLQAVSL